MKTVNTSTITPVDALWTLYQSQSKANKKKFRSLIREEEGKEQITSSSKSFVAIGTKRREDFNDGEYITLKSHEDVDRYFESM